MNSVTLAGRLVSPPQALPTAGGAPRVLLHLAISRTTIGAGGRREHGTVIVPVEAEGGQAEIAARQGRQGASVAVLATVDVRVNSGRDELALVARLVEWLGVPGH